MMSLAADARAGAGAGSGSPTASRIVPISPGVLGVSLAGFTAFLDLYATQSLLPLLARQFRASALEVSATVSATTVAVALAAPIAGPLADMLGRKRVVVAATFALSAATLLTAASASLRQLIAWRFAQGLFIPAIFAATVAYISEEWAGHDVGRAMAGYVTGNILGGVLGRVVSGLVAARSSWHQSFVVLGGLNLAAASAIWAVLPRSRRFTREPSAKALLGGAVRHLANPRLVVAYASGFSLLFSSVATFSYVNFHLAAPPFLLGPGALGCVFFVYLSGIATTHAAGRLLDRFEHRRIFAAAMAAASCGMLLTLLPNLLAVLAGLAVCAAMIFVCQATANCYVGAAAAHARASAAGLYVACYYAGGTAGAIVPGFAWRAGGWPACVALIAAVQLGSAALAWSFWGGASGLPPARNMH